MVATVVALRLRSMRHLLAREWWRLLVLIAGSIWLLTLLPSVLWAGRSLSVAAIDSRIAAFAVLGLLCAAGWAAVPVLVAGGDDTLDPRRFTPFGVSASRIMPGLVVSSLITLPAIFFAFMWVVLALSWFSEGIAPGLLGLAGAVIQLVACVALAKVASSWAARVFAHRRARTIAFAAAGVAIATIGVILWRTLSRGLEVTFGEDFGLIVTSLARTPLVSAITAPGEAASGNWVAAWWLLAGGLGWAVVLLLAWRSNVAHALVTPVYRAAGGRGRPDAVLAAGRGVPFLVGKDRGGPAGAVFARIARAWSGDPRYISSLAGVVLLPALFVAVIIPAFNLDPRWSFAAPFVLATSIGWGRHNDVALDSSALWMDIVAGRRGGSVMRGRFAAVLVWALPLVAAAALVTVGWSGHWELAPAVVGTALGALGVSLGVAALSSVLLPYRTPAPGENPFGAEVGSVGAGLVGQFVSSAATLVLLPLVLVPCALAIFVDARWGILACLGGLGLGVVAYIYGTTVAGRLYDARSGRLLAAVR